VPVQQGLERSRNQLGGIMWELQEGRSFVGCSANLSWFEAKARGIRLLHKVLW
jgi:hypothetical protein